MNPAPRDFRRLANAGGVEFVDDLLRKLPRVRLHLFGEDHRGVRLVIAKTRVARGGHLRLEFNALRNMPYGGA